MNSVTWKVFGICGVLFLNVLSWPLLNHVVTFNSLFIKLNLLALKYFCFTRNIFLKTFSRFFCQYLMTRYSGLSEDARRFLLSLMHCVLNTLVFFIKPSILWQPYCEILRGLIQFLFYFENCWFNCWFAWTHI